MENHTARADDLTEVAADKLVRLADRLQALAEVPGPVDRRGCVRCERAHFDGFGCREHFDPHEEPRRTAEHAVRVGRDEAARALERLGDAGGGEPARVQARYVQSGTPYADLTTEDTCRRWAADWRSRKP